MAINAVYPEQYQTQLDTKVQQIQRSFSEFQHPPLDIYPSPASHYRLRSEFKIWHENGEAFYAMFEPGEYKKPFIVESFPVASTTITTLMPPLLNHINGNELLKHKLFQAEFLTTLSGDILVTLIYHKRLSEEWLTTAAELQQALKINIIGRSKGQKCVLTRDYVWEEMKVDGRTYHYQQPEGAFTQPNGAVCEKMLSWAVDIAKPLTGDLLELYCGNGNFTLPLSTQFDRVLATEISKTAVNAAKVNIEKNKIENIEIVRMSSEDFSAAMDGAREYRRLKDIDLTSYNFTTVLVDPPRAGLDDHTVDVVKRFDNIIYISCNPQTLHNNLTTLTLTHDIVKFAVFDQFPYTHHVESGVLLRKK